MISRLSWPALTAVLNIVLIDLVLSGDNAAATLVPWLLALSLLVWGCSGSFKEKVRGEKLKS